MTTSRVRQLTAVAALTTLTLLTAACGSESTTSSSARGGASASVSAGGDASASGSADAGAAAGAAEQYFVPPTELPVTQPVSKPIPTGLKIIYVQAPFPQADTIRAGVEEAAQTLGWTVEKMGYDPTNPATIASTVASAIDAKPDAIILYSLLTADFESQIPKAIEAGIPLIPIETPNEASEGVYPVLMTDVQLPYAGEILAAAVAADAAEAGVTAHVVQLTVPEVAHVLGYQDKGFEAGLQANCPECTRDLLDVKLADVLSGNFTQQVVSYLQAHPDVNYVVSNSGQLGNGLGPAMAQAGLTNVKNFGLSASNVQTEELRSGEPSVWGIQPYRTLGWIAADQIARIEVGDPTNLWDEEKLVYLLNQSNVGDINADDAPFPEGYQDMFKKMWKL